MSDIRKQLRARLATAGLAPNHRLGQNFMVDAGAIETLVTAAQVDDVAQIVEVGPGTGLLTQQLFRGGAKVLSVELDRGLYGLLQQEFAPQLSAGQFELVHGDCLENKNTLHPAICAAAAGPAWSLVSNLPYDVSLPVILNALALPQPPVRVAVTVQWEAAQRLCASPGEKSWGATAAVAQYAGTGEILRKLGPRCFDPAPRVDSALLLWRPERALPQGFGRWVRHLFAFRRKVLPRALRNAGASKEQALAIIASAGLGDELRVEACAPNALGALHTAWCEQGLPSNG